MYWARCGRLQHKDAPIGYISTKYYTAKRMGDDVFLSFYGDNPLCYITNEYLQSLRS